jgi:hypothetical protein
MEKNKLAMLEEMEGYAGRLMSLFEGYGEAYGTYDGTVRNEEKSGKLEIKATAKTIRKPVTKEIWVDHLMGDTPLGIIPIRDNDTCLWGVIDIDQYTVSYDGVLNAIKREELPLIVCRSKSGGMHAFLFMAEPVSAQLMQVRLREMSAAIGYGGSEIFPKQKTVHLDRGDLGSWLNMPYFDGDEGDRYGIKEGGLAMTIEEFLMKAEALQQPRAFLEQGSFRSRPVKDPDFGDAPPCLQHLVGAGFPEGTRNKGLFNLITFGKKKYGENWQTIAENWNREYMSPPLPFAELGDLFKSQSRKDYNYTCKDTPLVNHCNSQLCRTRKFGVGGEDDYPSISGLSVLDTNPPLWFVDVDGDRLELKTDELQNYKAFHKVCMEQMFRCFRMMKQDTWFGLVAEAMKNAVRIEVSEEVGKSGQFYELLEEFLTNRHKGDEMEDILLGRPWEDKEEGRHYFRLRDLQNYVEAAGFKLFNRGELVSKIKDLGGDKHFFNVKGRGVNVWWVPNAFRPMPPAEIPPIQKDPI